MQPILVIFIIEIFSIDTLSKIFGGGGFVAVILYILQMLRYKKKDVVGNNKIEAESEKVKAEAFKTTSEAQVNIADAALRLAQRLSEENAITKKQLENTQMELDITQDKLNQVQLDLNNEMQKNKEMSNDIAKLKIELANRK